MSLTALKIAAKRLLRGMGLELRRLAYLNSEETLLAHLFADGRLTTVLDVGANTGQYARLVREWGFKGHIVSFEAIPRVHAALSAASAGDSRWTVAACAALGGTRGTVDIHVAKNSVSSSLLKMQAAHLDAAPESRYVGVETVPLERLDELAPQYLQSTGAILLKIDTQGYEREVLKGAEHLLPRVAVIQVEMSLVPLYEGAPAFADMLACVSSLGFELFSIVPGMRNLATGRLLQADGFFVRPQA